MQICKLILILSFISFSKVLADDTNAAKDGVLNKVTESISNSIENVIGNNGDAEVQITTGEDYKPEYSIMKIVPLAAHPGVDAWFVQLQLNSHNIRGKSRTSINSGIGYRNLSENKKYLVGVNVFFDYDEEENSRGSVGLELRSSVFEAIANYYETISDPTTVGSFTERSLTGYDLTLVGEVPYLPWANVVGNFYVWEAEKNAEDTEGSKISLEMTVTPTIILEGGFNDNNNMDRVSFFKAYFVYPPRERVAATNKLIGDSAFSSGDMSGELLSKIKRTNKQVIESEGSGVVMAKAN
tara:strand:+ start:18 stop:908 length:891 start_codon:yes stop_codon:yes gene_type:complete